ncbi:MAG: hypothetical protein LAP85_06165 [Acidobacteriia bacterium]|nr:hypothetical protein [Terriglobia bacterium]
MDDTGDKIRISSVSGVNGVGDDPGSSARSLLICGNIAVIMYIAWLYAAGYFHDWDELVLEPFLILKGFKTYQDIATHHAPLLTESLARIYYLFGTSLLVRKVLLLSVSSATAIMTCYSAYLLSGKRAGVVSIVLFGILWPFYGGTNFWFDTFLPLFYLAGFLIILKCDSWKWFFAAGLCLGMGFLTKQLAGIVAIALMIAIYTKPKGLGSRFAKCFAFSAGVLLPIASAALWYSFVGRLGEAFYWIIQYNLSTRYIEGGGKRPPMGEIVRLITIAAPIILLLFVVVLSKAKRHLLVWKHYVVLALGICAAFSIFPRWESWHVVPSIPFLVIGLVLCIEGFLRLVKESGSRKVARGAVAMILLWSILVLGDVGSYYVPLLVDKIYPGFAQRWPLRSYGAPAWFDQEYARYLHDLPILGKNLAALTDKRDRILVWGWMGGRLYFDSDRLPPGRFYYILPWFTCLPRFKQDLQDSFEKNAPRFVVISLKQYPGTPSLKKLGIDLSALGYARLTEMRRMYPQMEIWEAAR